MKRHAMLRQRADDFIGQGAAAMLTGRDGVVVMARSELLSGSVSTSEMPVTNPISQLFESALSDETLKAGIARMTLEEELDQDANPPVLHERFDGQVAYVNGAGVGLNPRPFSAGFMGGGDWYVPGGLVRFSRYRYDGPTFVGEDPQVEFPVEDAVIRHFHQGWIVALIRGHMVAGGKDSYMHIESMQIVQADHGFQTDYSFILDGFNQATESISYAMLPLAYVISPNVIGNKSPIVYDEARYGDPTIHTPFFTSTRLLLFRPQQHCFKPAGYP